MVENKSEKCTISDFNIKEKHEFSISDFLIKNKTYIIILTIYFLGVVLASFCYKYIGEYGKEVLKNALFSENSKSVLNIFLNDIFVYFSVYAVTLVFGLCSIGIPIIYFMPLLNGFAVSLEINYLYSNYGIKGVGYSLLLIIPAATLFSAILFITIFDSVNMSKLIFESAFKEQKTAKIDVKSYLKKFAVYGILIIVISLIDSALISMISTVVSI